jgi:hypothetical protein
MKEQPTPETDDFILSQDYSPTGHQWRTFTRKLERERDEALNAIYNYKCEVEAWEILNKVKRERDEAREQLRIAVGLLSTLPQFANKHPEDVLDFVKEGAK